MSKIGRGQRIIAGIMVFAMIILTGISGLADEITEEQVITDEIPPQEESEMEKKEEENIEEVKPLGTPRAARQNDLAETIREVTIEVKDPNDSTKWLKLTDEDLDDYVFAGDEEIRVEISYVVKDSWKPVTTEDLFYYELPDFIGQVKAEEGYVTDGAETQAGRYKIKESGRIEIHFLENYVNKNDGQIIEGTVNFQGELKITQVENGTVTIDFGNIEKEINVDSGTIVTGSDLKITKSATDKGPYYNAVTGKTYIDYNVLVTAPRSNTKDMTSVVVKDELPTDGHVTYLDGSFQCNGQSSSEADVATDKMSFEWPLGTMKPGDSYTLTYTVEVDVAGVSDKSGNISVENNISANAAELEEERKDTATVVLQGSMDIAKEAVRKTEDDCIEYTVTIQADKNNEFVIQNVKVNDFFDETNGIKRDRHCKKYILGYEGFAVDGTSVSITPNMTDKTFVWNVGTLKPGEKKVLTYKVKVDEKIWIDENQLGDSKSSLDRALLNKVTATGDNMPGDCKSTAEAYYGKNWVTKGGTAEVTEDGKRIKYTVGVNGLDGYLGNKVIDLAGQNAKFTDKITSGNAVYDGNVTITMITYNADGTKGATTTDTKDIDGLTEFTYDLTGKTAYQFVYYVRATDSTQGALTVNNDAKVGIPGPGGSEQGTNHEISNSTETTGNVVVNKKLAGKEGVNHSWESNIVTPMKENWQYYDYMPVNQSTYTTFVQDSIKVEYDGTILTEVDDYTLSFSQKDTGENQFHITFLNDIEGSLTKPIKITYKTVIDESKIKAEWTNGTYMWFANMCEVLDEEDETLASGQASTNYYPEYSLIKNLWLNDSSDSTSWFNPEDNTISWKIAINRNGSLTNPTAYISEILPDGLEIVDVEVHPGWENTDGTIRDGYADDGLPTPTVSFAKDAGNGNKWNLVVDNIHYKPAISSKHQVRLKIITKVTDLSLLDGEKHTLKNTAQMLNSSGDIMGEDTSSGEIQVETLTKTSHQGKATIDYTIEVNPAEADILRDKDRIELHDVMGDGLSLDISTLKVQAKNGGGWETLVRGRDYTLALDDMTGSAFKLTVPDSRYLTITYTALVSGKVGQTITATNVVSYYGYESGGTTEEGQFVIQKSGATSSTEAGVVISKMDFETFESLPGTEFGIAPVKIGQDGKVILNSQGEPALDSELANPKAGSNGVFVTDIHGSVTFRPLDDNVIYCYWEKKALEGYALDSTKHYFAIEDNTSQLQNAGWEYESLQPGALIQVFNKKRDSNKQVKEKFELSKLLLKDGKEEAQEAGDFHFVAKLISGDINQVEGLNAGELEAQNAKNGNIVFDTLTYRASGTYIYEITEVNGGAVVNGVSYDDSVYYVEVQVSDAANHQLVVDSVKHYKNYELGVGLSDEITGTITFVNKVVPDEPTEDAGIKIKKSVDKEKVGLNQLLTYTIELTNLSDKSEVTKLKLKDYVPEYTRYRKVYQNGSYGVEDGKEYVCWLIGSIKPGETMTFQFTVKTVGCIPEGTVIRNSAFVYSSDISDKEVKDEDKVISNTVKSTISLSANNVNQRKQTNQAPATGNEDPIAELGLSILLALTFITAWSRKRIG